MAHINQRWAAPEILEGRDYSVNSDLYSMGLTFWETRYREIAYHEVCQIIFVNFGFIIHFHTIRLEILQINSKWKYVEERDQN